VKSAKVRINILLPLAGILLNSLLHLKAMRPSVKPRRSIEAICHCSGRLLKKIRMLADSSIER
jgi:hypothetical protein